MCCTGDTVLSCNFSSFSKRLLIFFRAGSIRTEVKSAVTSYHVRHSPSWRVINPANRNVEEHNSNTYSTANTTTTTIKTKIGHVVVPYTKGLSESFKSICGKYGIQAYFKGNITIKQTLMMPKDQDPKDNKSGLT